MKSKTSDYDKALHDLEEKRCDTCYGSGVCDDAEPGDISFREWVCTTCNGTGFKPLNQV